VTSELERLVHDLRVHEEQVQLQQDQLTETQQLLEASRDRYADLYDYAPLPYVTLDRNGVIEDINLTGADLLGRARPLLAGRPSGSTWTRPIADVPGHMRAAAALYPR